MIGAGHVGWTFKWKSNGTTSTCLDVDTTYPSLFQAVGAHEIGHVLGLDHDDRRLPDGSPESIMTACVSDEPIDQLVTCVDALKVGAAPSCK